tara:strand:+ start:1168 stop:1407 length:240 start_codon:yes stop_codon:yes gene_type:complete
MDPLTVYTKKNCNFCDQIKQVLNLKNVAYEEKILDTDFSAVDFIESFGKGATFPQIVHEDYKVGGCIQTIKYLKSKDLI